jgi:hypothetical protein
MVHDAAIVNAVHLTMIYLKDYNKLITKGSNFHTMNSILLQHVESTLWKGIVLLSTFCPSFIFIIYQFLHTELHITLSREGFTIVKHAESAS